MTMVTLIRCSIKTLNSILEVFIIVSTLFSSNKTLIFILLSIHAAANKMKSGKSPKFTEVDKATILALRPQNLNIRKISEKIKYWQNYCR